MMGVGVLGVKMGGFSLWGMGLYLYWVKTFVLFNQLNNLTNSNKDCDWLILACFLRVQMHDDATSFENNC